MQTKDALGVTEAITLIEDLAAVRGVYESQHGSLADAVAGAVCGPLQSVLAAWCAVCANLFAKGLLRFRVRARQLAQWMRARRQML